MSGSDMWTEKDKQTFSFVVREKDEKSGESLG